METASRFIELLEKRVGKPGGDLAHRDLRSILSELV
jgi:hypothetical protein